MDGVDLPHNKNLLRLKLVIIFINRLTPAKSKEDDSVIRNRKTIDLAKPP